MKLWEVTNGFMGDGYVHVLVIAETKKKAKELASAKFKDDALDIYPPNYWKKLDVELLADDTSIEYVGEVSD